MPPPSWWHNLKLLVKHTSSDLVRPIHNLLHVQCNKSQRRVYSSHNRHTQMVHCYPGNEFPPFFFKCQAAMHTAQAPQDNSTLKILCTQYRYRLEYRKPEYRNSLIYREKGLRQSFLFSKYWKDPVTAITELLWPTFVNSFEAKL